MPRKKKEEIPVAPVKQKESDATTFHRHDRIRDWVMPVSDVITRVVIGVGILVYGSNFTNFAIGWEQRAQAETAGQLFYNVDIASLRAVSAVEQGYLRKLRRPNVELEPFHRQRAKELALRHLKASLGPKGMKALRKSVGEELDDMLDGSIEAAVYELKLGQGGGRHTEVMFPMQPSSLSAGRSGRLLSSR